MNLIAAGLGDDVNLPARIAALFGGKEVGLNLELLDRFNSGAHDDGQRQAVVVVYSVVKVVVRTFPVAVNEQLMSGPQIVGPRAAHNRAAHAVAGPADAGTQNRKLNEVAPVQRQVLHLTLLNHTAEH